MELDQDKQEDGRMSVGLILLANSIALDIFLDILCKARLLELVSNKLMGFEVPRVTSSLMIVTVGQYGAVE